MTKLIWGEINDKSYTAGVDKGVLYPPTGSGVAWNGLVAVNETEDDSAKDVYIDGQLLQKVKKSKSTSLAVEAYSYPTKLDERALLFGFSYRVLVGSGYQIHIVYNARFSQYSINYKSLSEDMEPSKFSWVVESLPIRVSDDIFASHVVIDSRVTDQAYMSAIESILYGSEATNSRLPTINELEELFEPYATLLITDNGDGTWTADGDGVTDNGDGSFSINSPTAIFLTDVKYQISSY